MVKKSYFLIFCLLMGLQALQGQTQYKTLMHDGNRLFEKGAFSGSASKFSGAAKESPKDFGAHYNLGNALYKDKKYTEAQAEYQKALSLASEPGEKMAAQYNLGNALMKLDDSKAAAQAYKKALKLDPYNEAARRNYEIAMLKEKEKQQNRSKSQQGGSGGGNDKSKDSQKDPNGKPNEGKGGQGGEGQGEDGDRPGESPRGSRLSKQEQQAVINRAEGRESETARKILNKNTYSMPQSNEKDW